MESLIKFKAFLAPSHGDGYGDGHGYGDGNGYGNGNGNGYGYGQGNGGREYSYEDLLHLFGF